MGLIKMLSIILLVCCFVTEILAVGADYYFGKALRSEEILCYKKIGMLGERYCLEDCKDAEGFCYEKNCFCVNLKKVEFSQLGEIPGGKNTLFNYKNAADNYEDRSPKIRAKRVSRGSREFHQRPALRHHIAHFCPNLEDARACIRKCMKVGKPAFCGKDHVCYCGHTYTSHDNNEKVDSESVYSEFKDLYEKYFGRNVA